MLLSNCLPMPALHRPPFEAFARQRTVLLVLLVFSTAFSTRLQAQVLNSTLAEDPISAHWRDQGSAFNPAWAGASGEGTLFLGGQNLVGVLDELSGGSSTLGVRAPIGNSTEEPGQKALATAPPLTFTADVQYSYVPFVARYVTGNVGFAYRVLNESEHRVWVGGTVGLGSREFITNFGGQPDPLGQPTRFYPNLNAGLWYRYQGFHFGAGGTHLGNPTVDYGANTTRTIQQRFYVLVAYEVPGDGFLVTPAIWTRYVNGNGILSDFLVDAELGGGFEAGVGYRIDLSRRPIPNPSNPLVAQRFQQIIATAGLRVADVLTLRGSYLYTPGTFVIERNNVEASLVYRFRKG